MSSRLVSPIGWRKSSAIVGLAVAMVLLVGGSAMAHNLGLLEKPMRIDDIEFRPVSEPAAPSDFIDTVVANSGPERRSQTTASSSADVGDTANGDDAPPEPTSTSISDGVEPASPSSKPSSKGDTTRGSGDDGGPKVAATRDASQGHNGDGKGRTNRGQRRRGNPGDDGRPGDDERERGDDDDDGRFDDD